MRIRKYMVFGVLSIFVFPWIVYVLTILDRFAFMDNTKRYSSGEPDADYANDNP